MLRGARERVARDVEQTDANMREKGEDKLGKPLHRQEGASGWWADLHGDRGSIALLLLLYTLQGVPMGLAASVPLLLQERGASYSQQAVFSLVSWPFSLKLLWAPLVDSCYSRRIGRRRTWLLPTQMMCGLLMIASASSIDHYLGDPVPAQMSQSSNDAREGDEGVLNVSALTGMFLVLYLLMATQDIAVDGWALNMLQRCNVGWASTCNSTGQTLGYTLSFIVFMALNNDAFSAQVRAAVGISEPPLAARFQGNPLLTLGSFMAFWGWVFAGCTVFIFVFKPENPSGTASKGGYRMTSVGGEDEAWELEGEEQDQAEMSIVQTYACMADVMRLSPVRHLALLLLTAKVAFAAADAVTTLKVQEAGVPKETMALLGVAFTPLALCLPTAISKYTQGSRPLSPFVYALPFRLAWNGVLSLIVMALQSPATAVTMPSSEPVSQPNGFRPVATSPAGTSSGAQLSAPMWSVLILATCVVQILQSVMFVSQMAFFAKVADARIGGTYMTLLNTLANLGAKWPASLILWLIDLTTATTAFGHLDGYHVCNLACTLFGLGWLAISRDKLLYLDRLPASAWLIHSRAAPPAGSEARV